MYCTENIIWSCITDVLAGGSLQYLDVFTRSGLPSLVVHVVAMSCNTMGFIQAPKSCCTSRFAL